MTFVPFRSRQGAKQVINSIKYRTAMNTVGQGVKEIRIRDAVGAFRVMYVAKFADAVYVLHCFQKKTEKTNKADLDLAAKRYRDLLQELG